MEAVTIKGTVYKILEKKQISDNFTAQDIVIMVTETYRNGNTKDHLIPIQFSNQRCDEIDKVAEGEQVEVKFNLSGNEWQGKFFLKASGWVINATSSVGSGSPQPQMQIQESSQTASQNSAPIPTDDDLPF
jgi:hypothetical protein